VCEEECKKIIFLNVCIIFGFHIFQYWPITFENVWAKPNPFNLKLATYILKVA
jgi:hypothetical protein